MKDFQIMRTLTLQLVCVDVNYMGGVSRKILSRIVILQSLDISIVSSSYEVFSKTEVFRKIKQR